MTYFKIKVAQQPSHKTIVENKITETKRQTRTIFATRDQKTYFLYLQFVQIYKKQGNYLIENEQKVINGKVEKMNTNG